MTTETAPVELKVFKPSAALAALAEQVKAVAKFDPGLIQVFEQATRINAVTKLMENAEMVPILEKLEGSPAGFMSDLAQKNQKYDVKDRNMAVAAALQQGARLVGKEFGIIRGNCFLAKPFYKRMLDELGQDNGITASCRYRMLFWDTELGEITLNGPIATCKVSVTYKLVDKDTGAELKDKVFARSFQIKTFPTDTPDLWAGKFERRAWQKLLGFLTGVEFGDETDENGAGQAATPPPVGSMKPAEAAAAPAAAPSAPKAEDAVFKEVVAPAAAAAESTSKPQKAYADMSKEERAAATRAAHDQSAAAVAAKPAVETAPAASGEKPGLF